MNNIIKTISICVGLLVASNAFALDFVARKLQTWKRGESIAGEEFVAATEEVADYVSKLQRPTEPFKYMSYMCQVKMREISTSVYFTGSGSSGLNGYTYVQSVYAIKDCAPASE